MYLQHTKKRSMSTCQHDTSCWTWCLYQLYFLIHQMKYLSCILCFVLCLVFDMYYYLSKWCTNTVSIEKVPNTKWPSLHKGKLWVMNSGCDFSRRHFYNSMLLGAWMWPVITMVGLHQKIQFYPVSYFKNPNLAQNPSFCTRSARVSKGYSLVPNNIVLSKHPLETWATLPKKLKKHKVTNETLLHFHFHFHLFIWMEEPFVHQYVPQILFAVCKTFIYR